MHWLHAYLKYSVPNSCYGVQTDHYLGVTFHPLEVPGTSQCVLIDSFPRAVMIWTYWLSIGWTQAMQSIRWSFSLLNDKGAIRWGLSPNQQIETCFYSEIWVIFSDRGDIKICWLPTTCPIHFDISRWNLRHIWHIPPQKMAHQKMIKSKVHPIDLKNMFFRHAEENHHCAKTSTWDLGILVPSTLGRMWAEGLNQKIVSKIPQNCLVELRGLKFCANTKRIGIS